MVSAFAGGIRFMRACPGRSDAWRHVQESNDGRSVTVRSAYDNPKTMEYYLPSLAGEESDQCLREPFHGYCLLIFMGESGKISAKHGLTMTRVNAQSHPGGILFFPLALRYFAERSALRY